MAETINIKENVGRKVTDVELLTRTVEQLTAAVQTQNDVILVLLHNMKRLGLEMPDWSSPKDVSDDISEPIKECVKVIRKAYGPSETDKS